MAMPKYKNIKLRKADLTELKSIYDLMFTDEAWVEFNAPYFPYSRPTLVEFEQKFFNRLMAGKTALLIEFDGQAVGSVSYYWEDENTRWLEIGIAIYDQRQWSQGIGRKALPLWIDHLFATLEIERVGLTTWSGNPRMVACAQAIGMQLEAQIRKVRYYKGIYYDSIKLGVIREQWSQNKAAQNQ